MERVRLPGGGISQPIDSGAALSTAARGPIYRDHCHIRGGRAQAQSLPTAARGPIYRDDYVYARSSPVQRPLGARYAETCYALLTEPRDQRPLGARYAETYRNPTAGQHRLARRSRSRRSPRSLRPRAAKPTPSSGPRFFSTAARGPIKAWIFLAPPWQLVHAPPRGGFGLPCNGARLTRLGAVAFLTP